MERREIVYSGRVQGVGFRATARRVAAGFAVSGWVRNEEDGTVRLEVQGATRDVEAFVIEVRTQLRGFIKGETARYGLSVIDESGFEIAR